MTKEKGLTILELKNLRKSFSLRELAEMLKEVLEPEEVEALIKELKNENI